MRCAEENGVRECVREQNRRGKVITLLLFTLTVEEPMSLYAMDERATSIPAATTLSRRHYDAVV